MKIGRLPEKSADSIMGVYACVPPGYDTEGSDSTDSELPKVQAANEHPMEPNDDLFLEILNSPGGKDYISYVVSDYENWETCSTSESWEIAYAPSDNAEGDSKTLTSGEAVGNISMLGDSKIYEDVVEPSRAKALTDFSFMIACISREERERATVDMTIEEDENLEALLTCTDKRIIISRAILKRIREHFLGNVKTAPESTKLTEKLDELDLNKSYSGIRFNSFLDIHFFNKEIPPAHLFPIQFSYKASLETDQYKSKIFVDERVPSNITPSQLQSINYKKRPTSDSSHINSTYKRRCNLYRRFKSEVPESILTSKVNANFMIEKANSCSAAQISFHDFEMHLKACGLKKLTRAKRGEFKFLQVAQHYSILKNELAS